MATCGFVGILAGTLYASYGGPTWAFLSLASFAVMFLMPMSLVVRMRWFQETEARRINTRFRELRESLLAISTSLQRLPQAVAMNAVENSTVAPAADPDSLSPGGGRKAQVGVAATERNPSSSTSVSVRVPGRLAAAVSEDGRRQGKLLRHLALPTPSAAAGRTLFIVAGKELRRYLNGSHTMEALHPSTIMAQVENSSGSALILEDSAFVAGPWFGADSAAGTLLANELLKIFAICQMQEIPVYFVRTRRDSNIYTKDFEANADLVMSAQKSLDWTEDYEFGLLGSLSSFVDMKKELPIG